MSATRKPAPSEVGRMYCSNGACDYSYAMVPSAASPMPYCPKCGGASFHGTFVARSAGFALNSGAFMSGAPRQPTASPAESGEGSHETKKLCGKRIGDFQYCEFKEKHPGECGGLDHSRFTEERLNQELAEKLGEVSFVVDAMSGTCRQVKDYIDPAKFLPILTASVGTLLQAERAATVKLAAEAQCEYCESQIPGKPGHGHWSPVGGENTNIHKSIAGAKWDSYCDARHILPLATPEAASALAAVVQRETEKLRDTLQAIADFAPGHGEVCEIIARRARAALK